MTMLIGTDEIVKVVDLAAPVPRVWRALTDHEAFGAWFRVALDGPFRLGEISRGKMTYPGFEGWPWRARVEAMEPERHFAFRWPHASDPLEDLEGEPTTLVTFRLEPTAGGTRLTITEAGFAALPEDKRMEALRSNTQGWDEQAKNIAGYVGS